MKYALLLCAFLPPFAVAQIYLEHNGQVVVEAERFTQNLARDGHQFLPTTATADYSGTSAMRALPEDARAWPIDYLARAPELRYDVLIHHSGRYQFWVRANGAGGKSDSLHAGINGIPVGTRQTDPDYRFVWLLMGSVDLAAGRQQANIWVRESGITVDKILLTADRGFIPFGTGPRASIWVDGSSGQAAPTVTITGPAEAASFPVTETVTLSGVAMDREDGDLSSSLHWSSSRDGDLGAGASLSTTLTAGAHTVTARTADSGGLSAASSVAITIQDDAAPGGAGSSSGAEHDTGAFLETGGQVVLEAESFSANLARDSHQFLVTTALADYSGTGAMRALPEDTRAWTTDYAGRAPELRYEILISSGGRYHLWVRANGAGGTSDSLHAGVNGIPVGTRQTDPDYRFVWLLMGSVDLSPGHQQVNIWVRESGITLDKILLTTDADYTPTGIELPQSARVAGSADGLGDGVTGSAILGWIPPTRNEDGSALTDLAGFRIYWGSVPGSYAYSLTINDPGATRHVVEGLTSGSYSFVATAFDTSGNESRFSNSATLIVP